MDRSLLYRKDTASFLALQGTLKKITIVPCKVLKIIR